jgi:HEAT repeat protein
VREYAGVGLAELGPRGARAIPELITALKDKDRFARGSAARTLGFLIEPGSAKRTEVVAALNVSLDDEDPEVRLAAAETLIKLGEGQKAAGALLSANRGTDSYFRQRAQMIIRRAKDQRPFIAILAKQVRDHDGVRREEALRALLLFAAPEEVRSALKSALAEDSPEIRQWAAAHLARITPSP